MSLSPVTPITPGAPLVWEALTPRESEVLELVCRGLSNEQIGRELYVSMNTVKSYTRGAYRKMGVDTRARAVIWGLQHGYGLTPVGPRPTTAA